MVSMYFYVNVRRYISQIIDLSQALDRYAVMNNKAFRCQRILVLYNDGIVILCVCKQADWNTVYPAF